MTLYPFERIHIDFAKHSGKEFLIISDAYSKYCDVKLMSCTQLFKVEEKLVEFFSIFGLPTELVSDNGPPFQSYGFDKFCENHKIKLTHSPPYHPPSNGQAERAVRTVKQCFFKFILGEENSLPIQKKIKKFIMYHNNSPSTVTGRSPSEIIFSFKPRTLLDLVNVKFKDEVDSFKSNEIKKIFINSKFKVDQKVMYRNHFKNYIHWIPATVLQVISKFTYLIRLNSNVRFVHEDQLKSSKLSNSIHVHKNLFPVRKEQLFENESILKKYSAEIVKKNVTFEKDKIRTKSLSEPEIDSGNSTVNFKERSNSVSEPVLKSCSGRIRLKVQRYGMDD